MIPEGTPLADLSAEINKFRESEILPQSGREYDILASKPLNEDITNVLAEMRNPNESYLRRWARRPKSLPQALSMVAAYNALARGGER